MKKILAIVSLILILLFLGLGIFNKVDLPSQDLGRHLKNGQIIWQTKSVPQTNFYSYTNPNEPFLNHHWLSGLIFYFIFNLAEFNGLIIFHALIFLLTFLLIFIVSSQKGDFWLAVLFSVPVIFLLLERTEIRPETFSYFLTAVFLYFLFNFSGSKKIFWLIPLQLLWVNLHIYFPIGVLMAAGYLLDSVIARRSIRNLVADGTPKQSRGYSTVKRISFLLLLLILVCLINPAGYKGAVYPLNIFKNYGYQIVENKSPFFLENLMNDPSIVFFKIAAFLTLLSFFFNFKRFSPFFFLAAGATILAGCQMLRNLPLVGLIALPTLCYNFAPLFKYFRKKFRRTVLLLPYFLTASLLIIVFLSFKGTIEIDNKTRGLGLTFQTAQAAEFFQSEKLAGPIFNNYDIGSYLIFYLYPQEKVFVDNRPEAYPSSFFDEYKEIQRDEKKWQEAQDKYNFNLIFFTHQEATPWGTKFVRERAKDANWPLVYADNHSVIFIKNIPANQEIIQKYRITAENIEQRIKPLIGSNDLKVNLSALNLLELLNRNDLAIALAEKLLQENPQNGRIHLELASLEASKGTVAGYLNAKRYLEKAIGLGNGLPAVYVQLGLINFNLNQFQEAKNAWQKALKINPDDDSAKSYLEQYQKLNLP